MLAGWTFKMRTSESCRYSLWNTLNPRKQIAGA
jgi:hypothetical protein